MSRDIDLEDHRVVKVEIPAANLSAPGFGPGGRFTRSEWGMECLKRITSTPSDLSAWLAGLTDEETVEFEREVSYQSGAARHVRFRARRVAVDLDGCSISDPVSAAGLTFPSPFLAAGAKFEASVDFSRSVFAERSDFTGARLAEAQFGETSFLQRADFTSTRFLRTTDFRNARFLPANFKICSFAAAVRFDKCTFGAGTRFNDSEFLSRAEFRLVTFQDRADFRGASFRDSALFQQAVFKKEAFFDHATFAQTAWFKKARFDGSSTFSQCRLGHGGFDDASFTASRFEQAHFKTAQFSRVQFTDSANFDGCQVDADLQLTGGQFTSYTSFSGMRVGGSALLDGAVFRGPTHFENAVFTKLSASKAQFMQSVRFTKSDFLGVVNFSAAAFVGGAALDSCNFAGSCHFEGASFTSCDFTDSKVADRIIFKRVIFRGAAVFNRLQATGDAWFSDVKFCGNASFFKAAFESQSRFEGANFSGNAFFESATFKNVAHFEGAVFAESPPSFMGVAAQTKLIMGGAAFPARHDASWSEAYLALKLISDTQGHTEQALKFNALELQSRVQSAAEGDVFKAFTWLYGTFSNFGRSIGRPLVWFAVLFALCYLLMLSYAFRNISPACQTHLIVWDLERSNGPHCAEEETGQSVYLSGYRAALEYTLGRSAGVLSMTAADRHSVAVNQRLFGGAIEPLFVRVIGVLVAVCSTAFLFLAALAARNRYRLK